MNAAKVLEDLKRRFPNEPEYHQAVEEVLGTIEEEYNQHPEFEAASLIERLCIPDRIISFRVTWVDDKGRVQSNMGYRVQHSNAIGPYKGGIRFHSSVNLGILKFLAFEQTFKNSLTTLPMGGAKGGSDFSPRGKSNAEVMRFCQAFMTELWRNIGPDTDVPAGDIGVGGREVGYMYGMYKKLARENTGTLTGKGLAFGGSLIRPEATGYGNVYFLQEMLKTRGIDLAGKRVCISGSGNVAQYTAEKLIELGAVPITMSDSDGYIYDPKGITREKLDYIMELKNLYRTGEADEIHLVYQHFDSVLHQTPTHRQLLPAAPEADAPAANNNYLFVPDAQTVLDNVLELYLNNTVYAVMLEARVGEHAARMTAMTAATDSTAELIEDLNLEFNRARQAAITTEISEIVGGSAALKKSDKSD